MADLPFSRQEIEREAAMLAYSLRVAERDHFDSIGHHEIRGALAYSLSVLGLWDDALSPDADNEPEREIEFQSIADEFAARHA